MSLSLRDHHRNPMVLGRVVGTRSDQQVVWIDSEGHESIVRRTPVLIIPLSPRTAAAFAWLLRTVRKTRP